MAEEQAWQEYWTGGDGGDAVGGAQRHKIAACWASFFAAHPAAAPHPVVVDIAAGRGAALKSAIDALAGQGFFLALDYAADAVADARRALGRISAAAADAKFLPLRDRSVDFAISQFGMEYAGPEAFAEAARILAPGGWFCALSHYRGGAIDLECAENERLLAMLARARLFAAARATLEASFSRRSRRDPKPIDLAIDSAFAGALARALSAVRAAPQSAAKTTLERFLSDMTRLSARRFAYEPSDAYAWLAGMENSLDAYRKRMQSMRAAALDADGVGAIREKFSLAGLLEFRAEPLILDDNRPPAAWVIEGRRP